MERQTVVQTLEFGPFKMKLLYKLAKKLAIFLLHSKWEFSQEWFCDQKFLTEKFLRSYYCA